MITFDESPRGRYFLALIMLGPPVLGFGGMFLATTVDAARRRLKGRTHIPGPHYALLRNIQTAIRLLALLFFAIALVSPAMRDSWSGGTNNGLQCLLLGFPYWGINIWFLLSPVIALWLRLAKLPRLQLIPFLIQCACAIVTSNAATFGPQYPGYALWVTAHWFMAASYAVPTSLALRSALLHKRELHPLPPTL